MTDDRTLRGTMTSTAPSQPPPDESMDEDVEDESVKSDAEQEIPGIKRYEIGFFGADYPIDALSKRLNSSDSAGEGDIFIPDFQRGYVWTKKQADRFIESLLLGLPVPGIFLSTDRATNRRLVIDGGQRLRTIQAFMDGKFKGRDFILDKGIHADFEGKSYHDLLPSDRRRFDDAIIHATIVRQEKPEGDERSLLYLFERLNTGGTAAQPHEIRRSLWGGNLNDLLKSLDKEEHWRNVYGPQSQRLKDQELILRFFALYIEEDRYGSVKEERTMKDFLTSFMARNRNIAPETAEVWRDIFRTTITFVNEALGREAFRRGRGLNAAIFDSVMAALAHRQKESDLPSVPEFKKAYTVLLEDQRFDDATSSQTSHQAKVKERLRLAREAFAENAL